MILQEACTAYNDNETFKASSRLRALPGVLSIVGGWAHQQLEKHHYKLAKYYGETRACTVQYSTFQIGSYKNESATRSDSGFLI